MKVGTFSLELRLHGETETEEHELTSTYEEFKVDWHLHCGSYLESLWKAFVPHRRKIS